MVYNIPHFPTSAPRAAGPPTAHEGLRRRHQHRGLQLATTRQRRSASSSITPSIAPQVMRAAVLLFLSFFLLEQRCVLFDQLCDRLLAFCAAPLAAPAATLAALDSGHMPLGSRVVSYCTVFACGLMFSVDSNSVVVTSQRIQFGCVVLRGAKYSSSSSSGSYHGGLLLLLPARSNQIAETTKQSNSHRTQRSSCSSNPSTTTPIPHDEVAADTEDGVCLLNQGPGRNS